MQQQISHKNKKISKLAESIWQGLENSVKNDSNFLQANSFELISNSIRVLSVGQSERSELNSHVYNLNMDVNSRVYKLNVVKNSHVHNLNLGKNIHVQKLNVVNKNTVTVEKQPLNNRIKNPNVVDDNHVQNLNVATTCSSSKDIFNKKTTTTNSEGIYENGIKKNIVS